MEYIAERNIFVSFATAVIILLTIMMQGDIEHHVALLILTFLLNLTFLWLIPPNFRWIFVLLVFIRFGYQTYASSKEKIVLQESNSKIYPEKEKISLQESNLKNSLEKENEDDFDTVDLKVSLHIPPEGITRENLIVNFSIY